MPRIFVGARRRPEFWLEHLLWLRRQLVAAEAVVKALKDSIKVTEGRLARMAKDGLK